MAENNFGLLSQFGLDLGTEEDVRSKLRAKRIYDATQFVPPSGPGDRPGQPEALGRFGAALGNAFGEKFRPERSGYGALPPEIASRLETVKATKTGFEEWAKANPDTKVEDRAEKYQEILAEAAFQNDLPDIGVAAIGQLQEKRAIRKKRELELEKLGYENDYEKATIKSRVYKTNIEAGKAGLIEAYPVGSRDPNASVVGMYNPEDGSLTTTGEDGQPVRLPMGKWKLDRPMWDPARGLRGGGGGGSGGGLRLTPTEAGRMRADFQGAMGLQRKYIDVFKMLDNAEKEGLGPIQGRMGKLLTTANSWIGFVEQLSSITQPTGKPTRVSVTAAKRGLMGGVTTTQYDMSNASDRAKFAAENAGEVARSLRGVIPGLEEKADAAFQLSALLTDLAYAKAMASENGATRSLSDLDFKVNMIAIGKDLNSPDALRNLLLADADRVNTAIYDKLSVYGRDNLTTIIDNDGLDRMLDIRNELEPYRRKPMPSSGATAGSGGAPEPDKDGWVTVNGVRVRPKAAQ